MKRFCLIVFAALASFPALAAEQGQLDASRTLFSVMAALDVAGTDAEASGHPLRAIVRRQLASKNIPVLANLREFVQQHRKSSNPSDVSQYVSFALVAGDPPEFKYQLTGAEVPPDVQELSGFRELMGQFHEQAGIDELWRKVQPEYEKAIAQYHEPVSRTVLEANAYLRNPTSGYMGRRFQIVLELLAPPNQVHTRSYKDDYFIVVTPSAEPRIHDIRHAYLHYLLDPLATKYSEKLTRVRGLRDFAQAAPALEESYKTDFLLLATESLIKAIEARLDRNSALAQQALQEGFVLAPYFYESLPAYEKQEAAMRLHFPDMIEAIDLGKEDRRLQMVQFASARSVKRAAPIAPPAATQSSVEKSLEDADKLYSARELDKAREAYLALARQTDDRSMHARAHYGLGRIAALRNEPELAEQLFRKTLELSPDPHTRSWTEVYLGRLAEGFGEQERAVEHYKSALGIEGAPPGARQAAEQGIQKLSKR